MIEPNSTVYLPLEVSSTIFSLLRTDRYVLSWSRQAQLVVVKFPVPAGSSAQPSVDGSGDRPGGPRLLNFAVFAWR